MKTSQFHYPSFFSSLFFIVCAMFLFLIAGILGLSALVTSITETQIDVPSIILFITIGFTGSLLAAAAVIAILKFTNNPTVDVESSTSISGLKIAIGIFTTGLILWIGSIIQSNSSINWFTLPLLTIPAVAIPIWLFIRLGTKDLYLGSRWRIWSTFGLSMSLTPFLLFVLETVVIIFLVIIFIFYVVANPDLTEEIQTLSSQFALTGPNPDEITELIVPYLAKPGVFISAILIFSAIVPLMEEAFKPLAVWFLVGKLKSQAQGFALGALCGAGFALVETFNNSAQTGEWASVLFARIGTGAMHITTTALISAAIYSAWHEHRYLRLFATYLFGVFLHGLWNLLAVTTGFSSLLSEYRQADRYSSIEAYSTAGLAVLTLALIIILVLSNRKQPKEIGTDTQFIATTVDNDTDI